MKSKLKKAKDNPKSHYWLKRADKAWGALVHRYNDKCAVNDGRCAGNLEAHHLLPRNHHANRHNVLNGILLCSAHHKWSKFLSAHMAPLAFAEWLIQNRPEQWEWVKTHKWDIEKNLDYKARTEYLIKLNTDNLVRDKIK